LVGKRERRKREGKGELNAECRQRHSPAHHLSFLMETQVSEARKKREKGAAKRVCSFSTTQSRDILDAL